MTDDRSDDMPETGPERDGREDERSDIEQIVQSRSDAVARGEGGTEPQPMTAPGEYSGVSGDGGVVKNQDLTQQ
jgi:hypothetical protein